MAEKTLDILLVDDESELRELISRTFTREGHRVTAVADGHAAIDYATTDEFDVILPSEKLGAEYHRLVAPIFDLVRNLLFRNAALHQTRDLVLPRLISGELDVSNLEIAVREGAA